MEVILALHSMNPQTKKLADLEFPVGSHLSKTDTTLNLTLDKTQKIS